MAGVNVELVHEYAKDLTWEGNHTKLSCAPRVAAEQQWRMDRLRGQVDCIVTDTSPLNCLIYNTDVPEHIRQWMIEDYKRRATYDVFIERPDIRHYCEFGRNETAPEALSKDLDILSLLNTEGIKYDSLPADRDSVDQITSRVMDKIA
jgi:hypothetical protein